MKCGCHRTLRARTKGARIWAAKAAGENSLSAPCPALPCSFAFCVYKAQSSAEQAVASLHRSEMKEHPDRRVRMGVGGWAESE